MPLLKIMDARPNPLPDPEDLAIDDLEVADSQIIRLPTVAGLLYETKAVEQAASPDLWAALADAVMSADTFDDGDATDEPDGDLADVIDLNLWRN